MSGLKPTSEIPKWRARPLKPCPKCGSVVEPAISPVRNTWFSYCCQECDYETPTQADYPPNHIWNARMDGVGKKRNAQRKK